MEDQKLNTPAIIELFGHGKMAGHVSEHVIGSSAFIRVEVPKTDRQEAFSRLLHPNSIYALNPCTEDVMMAMANSYNYTPITAWDLPDVLKNKFRQEGLNAGNQDMVAEEDDDDGSEVPHYDELRDHEDLKDRLDDEDNFA